MFNRPLSPTAAFPSNHLTQPSTDTQYWANADPLALDDIDHQLTQLYSQQQQSLSPFNMLDTDFNLDMLHYPETPSDDSNFATIDQNTKLADAFDDETTTTTSPNTLQLCSTQEAEQSFIYGPTFDGSTMPMKMSQEYGENCSIWDEVGLISEHGIYYPPGTSCQRELSIGEVGIPFTDSPLPMEESSTALPDDEDQFTDVMLSVFKFDRPQNNFTNTNNNSKWPVTKTEVLTPEASPKATATNPIVEIYFDQENQVHNEHNYNSKPIYAQNQLQNCKRTLHLTEDNRNVHKRKLPSNDDCLKDRVHNQFNSTHQPGKKAKINSSTSTQTYNTTTMRHRGPTGSNSSGKLDATRKMLHLNLQVAGVDRVRSTSMSVNTPVLESSMQLDLEQYTLEYDLVDFINSSQVNIA